MHRHIDAEVLSARIGLPTLVRQRMRVHLQYAVVESLPVRR